MSISRQDMLERPDGTRIAYEVLGPEDATRTVVLVHGLAAAGAQFAADAMAFAARGNRVLVPDLRGHGRSTRPPSDPAAQDFTIPLMTADMEALLEAEANGPVHWVGNSLGGILGLHLLARAPRRFASFASFGTAHRLNLPRASAGSIGLAYRLFGPRLSGAITARFTTDNVAARPLVARLIAQFDPRVGMAIAQNVRRYDLLEAALGSTCPMLIIEGGRDRLVNLALARSLPQLRGRPNLTHVHLKEGGHCANLDAKDAWRSTLLAFWESMDPAGGASQDL
ncbi:alpha/beta hydrolase [Arsenicitalea aurantiaca]|uniref:Alpha/beta hydrolase n=1 Tax=Arsenicitalea aurantiaca TaxID=1783274 RepID=A0A433X8I4_9HYPH|nr:alpha/beta hydrolase [Arsenicitalea aurantiaca]RUT30364.1 alpha/beta hydrolase [Arsenicitalea aurantiaca]